MGSSLTSSTLKALSPKEETIRTEDERVQVHLQEDLDLGFVFNYFFLLFDLFI